MLMFLRAIIWGNHELGWLQKLISFVYIQLILYDSFNKHWYNWYRLDNKQTVLTITVNANVLK